jgi:hypothetical protein
VTREVQAVHDGILARLEPALKAWYIGDPWPYVDLFDTHVTYFAPVTRGRLDGIEALRQLFAPIVGKINVPRFEIMNARTQLFGDTAVFTYGLNEYASDGSVARSWNATDVHRRTGDTWRIVHTHWSPASSGG